jgi:hypothetical protein
LLLRCGVTDRCGQHGYCHYGRCETEAKTKHCFRSSHVAAMTSSRQWFLFQGIVGPLYVEFAFEAFIRRSSIDDALPHQNKSSA